MEIIKPSEISGKIMSLIEDANQFVIIVSPYYKLGRWEKLLKRIDAAKRRGVQFTFFVRKPESREDEACVNEVKRIGFVPIEIERLHAKLYLNESEAIISSMNLNISSDTGSLDIAVKTQSPQEYMDVFQFYERYIKQHTATVKPYSIERFLDQLDERVADIFQREAQIEYGPNEITIHGKNIYTIQLSKGRTNSLGMNCILSGKEFGYLSDHPQIFEKGELKIELQEGKGRTYDLIWGTLSDVMSTSFNSLQQEEAGRLLDTIIGFVSGVEQMKNLVRNRKNSYQ